MKKLTKASIEALMKEIPVLSESIQRQIIGGSDDPLPTTPSPIILPPVTIIVSGGGGGGGDWPDDPWDLPGYWNGHWDGGGGDGDGGEDGGGGGGGGGGSGGGTVAPDPYYGNPHDLSKFPIEGKPQISGTGMCVTESVDVILKYMGVNIDINRIIKDVAKAGNISISDVIMKGITPSNLPNIINNFFDSTYIGNSTSGNESNETRKALFNSTDPVFATIMGIHEGQQYAHEVVIVKTEASVINIDGQAVYLITGYDVYDPTIGGIVRMSSGTEFKNFYRINDLNTKYKDSL